MTRTLGAEKKNKKIVSVADKKKIKELRGRLTSTQRKIFSGVRKIDTAEHGTIEKIQNSLKDVLSKAEFIKIRRRVDCLRDQLKRRLESLVDRTITKEEKTLRSIEKEILAVNGRVRGK